MVDVKVTATYDFGDILHTLSKENIDQALYYMMDSQALSDTNNYVPNRGGELRMSGHVEGQDTMVWQTPYANAQFQGTAGKPAGVFYSDRQRKWFFANLFDDSGNYIGETGYTTPGTGPHWDEVAWANHGNDWIDAFMVGAGLK